jgi:hypothetical protein
MTPTELYKLAEQIEAELDGNRPYSFPICAFRGETEKEIRISLISRHLNNLIEMIKKETDKD